MNQTKSEPKNVIVVASTKSVGVAIVLSFFFGPLGMLYSTVSGGLIMMAVSFVFALVTMGLGLLITWPICIIWAARAAKAHNAKLLQGIK